MTRTIADYLSRNDTRLEMVTVTLLAREDVKDSDLNVFYERAVGLATVLAQGDRLKSLLSELYKCVERIGEPTLLERVRELENDIMRKRRAADSEPQPLPAAGNSEPPLEALADFSQRAVGLATDAATDPHWSDRQLEAELARTKLHGLLTQLNIKETNRRPREARYHGIHGARHRLRR